MHVHCQIFKVHQRSVAILMTHATVLLPEILGLGVNKQLWKSGFIVAPRSSNTKNIFYKPTIYVLLFLIKTCLVFNTALHRLVLTCCSCKPQHVYNGNGESDASRFPKYYKQQV